MATVVISAYNVANSPGIGGHFWVYMQYAHGLRRLGYDVVWLEAYRPSDRPTSHAAVSTFFRRMERHGFGAQAILYEIAGPNGDRVVRFTGMNTTDAEAAMSRADLLLNFHYAIDPDLLSRFRRTALVDIDPGLLQHWIRDGQLQVPPHDLYLTTGETVGKPGSRIPDCGLQWIEIRPPVCLDLWPYSYDPACRRFTTVSTWLGGEYVTERRHQRKRVLYENDKRVSFLRFVDLPTKTPSELELAIHLKRQPNTPDQKDRAMLERKGWSVKHALDVAGTPGRYRAYIQSSRGEFSCIKPSCIEFQNAWISDRSLCYLASGKPVVVQDSGPSSRLPADGKGMLRFSTLDEAAEGLARIDADYEGHCRAARRIAEVFFDSDHVLTEMLNRIDLAPQRRRTGGKQRDSSLSAKRLAEDCGQ